LTRLLKLGSFTVGAIATLSLLPGLRTLAQSPEGRLQFDVASVKLDNGPVVFGVTGQMIGGPGTADPGRLTITQRGMKTMIQTAYAMGLDQVYGPAWFDEAGAERYTIAATMPPTTTKEQFQIMFQNLLADRFHLVVRHETKDFPGYELVVAPGGLKVKERIPDPNAPPARGGRDAQGFRILSGQTGYVVTYPQPPGVPGLARVTSRLTMSEFAKHMGALVTFSNTSQAGVATPRVIDKTGLTGVYDLRLAFVGTTVLPGLPPQPQAAADAPPVASDPGESGQNLFAALENQFGLRLVKTKGVPVDVLVVDHVDKTPTGN